MIRLVIADDHALVRAGFRRLLEDIADVVVVAEAGDGKEALAAAREHEPDILLLDLSMPVMSGLEVVRSLTRDGPRIAILILSLHEDQEYVVRALRGGAAGYVVKDAAASELEVALRAVAAGNRFVSPKVTGPILQKFLDALDEADGLSDP